MVSLPSGLTVFSWVYPCSFLSKTYPGYLPLSQVIDWVPVCKGGLALCSLARAKLSQAMASQIPPDNSWSGFCRHKPFFLIEPAVWQGEHYSLRKSALKQELRCAYILLKFIATKRPPFPTLKAPAAYIIDSHCPSLETHSLLLWTQRWNYGLQSCRRGFFCLPAFRPSLLPAELLTVLSYMYPPMSTCTRITLNHNEIRFPSGQGPYGFHLPPSLRPLKINGLFLVQNFPKLNARARRQNKKEKTKTTLSY